MTGTGDEPWESYYLQLDGRLTSVAVHLGLHARAPVAELPILTRISVPVVGNDAHFFTSDEGDFLDRMVAGLETLVGRRGGAPGPGNAGASVRDGWNRRDPRFGVDLTWEHTLFRSVVGPHVVGLARRAARFGGVYDGWGCPVVGSDGR